MENFCVRNDLDLTRLIQRINMFATMLEAQLVGLSYYSYIAFNCILIPVNATVRTAVRESSFQAR